MIPSNRATGIIVGGALAVGLLGSAGTAFAFPHETRLVGPNQEYRLIVGFKVEPAFEDAVNGPDVIVSRTSDGKPINTDAGDVFDVQVEVQLRDEDAFHSNIVQAAPLLGGLKKAFGTLNRYQGHFRPTVDGPYAFRLTGTIADASQPLAGPITVDETFVCGHGSLTPGHGFGCVGDPQPFPLGHKDKGGRDKTGYEDNDGVNEFK